MSGNSVTVVVLSHNRPEMLRAALASVAAQTHRPSEVIVVDNRSPRSGDVARVVGGFDGVRLIAHPDNRGYTGGMNSGLSAASGDYVFLTEDDMILDPGCVAALVRFLSGRPDVGLASGLVLKHGTDVILCAGGDVNLGGRFHFRLGMEGQRYDGRLRDPFPVTFVTGSMVFARTTFLKRIGGFRSDFHLYMEDVELCLRVRKLGLRLMVVPEAVAHHIEPPPGPVREEILFHKVKNLIAVYLIHAPIRVLPEFAIRYGIITVVRQMFTNRAAFTASLRGWLHTLGRLRFLGRERSRAADWSMSFGSTERRMSCGS